jgi:RINT-1/TIP-1 family
MMNENLLQVREKVQERARECEAELSSDAQECDELRLQLAECVSWCQQDAARAQSELGKLRTRRDTWLQEWRSKNGPNLSEQLNCGVAEQLRCARLERACDQVRLAIEEEQRRGAGGDVDVLRRLTAIHAATLDVKSSNSVDSDRDQRFDSADSNRTLVELELRARSACAECAGHVRRRLCAALVDELLVDRCGWPGEAVRLAGGDLARFDALAGRLCEAQLLASLSCERRRAELVDDGCTWLVDALLAPVLRRFRYHFSGDRPTNDFTKAHWIYEFAQRLLARHAPFLGGASMQGALDRAGLGYVSAQWQFAAGLVRAIAAKMHRRAELAQLRASRQLLTRAIDEACRFDALLRDQFDYPLLLGSMPSVVAEAFGTRALLSRWLDAELDSASRHFDVIVQLDNDDHDGDDDDEAPSSLSMLLPSCARLVDLVDAMNDRHVSLRGACRRRFWLRVEQPLLMRYVAYALDDVGERSMRDTLKALNSIDQLHRYVAALSIDARTASVFDGDDDDDERRTMARAIDALLDRLLDRLMARFRRDARLYLDVARRWPADQRSDDEKRPVSGALLDALSSVRLDLALCASRLTPPLFARALASLADCIDEHVREATMRRFHFDVDGGQRQYVADMGALQATFRAHGIASLHRIDSLCADLSTLCTRSASLPAHIDTQIRSLIVT